MEEKRQEEQPYREGEGKGTHCGLEFIPSESRLREALSLLASTRSDGMYTRLSLLHLLIDHPCTKLEVLKALRISRPYLDRILADWAQLGIIDVRDTSALAKPRVTIFLLGKPVFQLTKLDDEVEESSDPERLMELARVLISPTKIRILKRLSEDGIFVNKRGMTNVLIELGDAFSGSRQALYRHLRGLISSRLLMKVNANIVCREERRRVKAEKWREIWEGTIEENTDAGRSSNPWNTSASSVIRDPRCVAYRANVKKIQLKIRIHK